MGSELEKFLPLYTDAMKEAIKQAAPRGWEAEALIALIVCGTMFLISVFWFFISRENKRSQENAVRETRMAHRIDELENKNETLAEKCAEAQKQTAVALMEHPCLFLGSNADRFIERINARLDIMPESSEGAKA